MMPTPLSPRVSESRAQAQKQPDGELFTGLHRQAPKLLWRQAAGKLLPLSPTRSFCFVNLGTRLALGHPGNTQMVPIMGPTSKIHDQEK